MNARSAILVLTIFVAIIDVRLAGQPAALPFIVVFHDNARLSPFPAARADERARANPNAWSYLDRRIAAAVQSLERQHGFRADHVYSTAVRGFAARLTAGQVAALGRNVMVSYIEADTPVWSLEQQLPWGIDRIDADQSSAQSGDGIGAIENVNVYVLDNGVDRTHPDLNVVRHVNFTSTANVARCAHGTRVAGVIAARDDDFGVVGVVPGAPITAVKVTACEPVFASASSVIKGVD